MKSLKLCNCGLAIDLPIIAVYRKSCYQLAKGWNCGKTRGDFSSAWKQKGCKNRWSSYSRKCLAPQHGLEPRTRWLIPPVAGLCRPIIQITADSSLFDLSFEGYSLTLIWAFLSPYDIPWTLKNFCSPAPTIFRIVMLVYAPFTIITVSTIISACWLTLNNVNPVWHN